MYLVIVMKYTESNLRNALRRINPESYHAYVDLAKLTLPQVLDRMFVVGFVANMRGEIDMSKEDK